MNSKIDLRMQKAVPDGIRFIRGVELSCRMEIAKCHILGYNYDPGNKVFREFVAEASQCGPIPWAEPERNTCILAC